MYNRPHVSWKPVEIYNTMYEPWGIYVLQIISEIGESQEGMQKWSHNQSKYIKNIWNGLTRAGEEKWYDKVTLEISAVCKTKDKGN